MAETNLWWFQAPKLKKIAVYSQLGSSWSSFFREKSSPNIWTSTPFGPKMCWSKPRASNHQSTPHLAPKTTQSSHHGLHGLEGGPGGWAVFGVRRSWKFLWKFSWNQPMIPPIGKGNSLIFPNSRLRKKVWHLGNQSIFEVDNWHLHLRILSYISTSRALQRSVCP